MLDNGFDNEADKLKSLLFNELYQQYLGKTLLDKFKVLLFNASMDEHYISLNTIKE